MSGKNETRFMSALEALFTGADTQGESGFVNLMSAKRRHFAAVREELARKIQQIAPEGQPFREELFDKLHHFFSRHFCESGSVYFRDLRAADRTYDRVFADGRDIALAWKTKNLFYVKSDRILQSIPVEFQTQNGSPRRFFFDAQHAQSPNSSATPTMSPPWTESAPPCPPSSDAKRAPRPRPTNGENSDSSRTTSPSAT